jgi:hypothetical protein
MAFTTARIWRFRQDVLIWPDYLRLPARVPLGHLGLVFGIVAALLRR